MFLIFFSTIPHTPRPPLFPYTTLFRSESLRDLIAGTLETYLSVMSNRTNDIMKTLDRKSTRLNSSHRCISYAVFCLKKKNFCPWNFDLESTNAYNFSDHNIRFARRLRV